MSEYFKPHIGRHPVALLALLPLLLSACTGDNEQLLNREFCSTARQIEQSNRYPLPALTRDEQLERFADQVDRLRSDAPDTVSAALKIKSEGTRAVISDRQITVTAEQDRAAAVAIEIALKGCGLDGSIFAYNS